MGDLGVSAASPGGRIRVQEVVGFQVGDVDGSSNDAAVFIPEEACSPDRRLGAACCGPTSPRVRGEIRGETVGACQPEALSRIKNPRRRSSARV